MTSLLAGGDSDLSSSTEATPSTPPVATDGERSYVPSITTISTDSPSLTPSSSVREQGSNSDCSSSLIFHLTNSITAKPRGPLIDIPSTGSSSTTIGTISEPMKGPSSPARLDDMLLIAPGTPGTSNVGGTKSGLPTLGKPGYSRKHKTYGPSGQRIKSPDVRIGPSTPSSENSSVRATTTGSDSGSGTDRKQREQQQNDQDLLSPASSIWTTTPKGRDVAATDGEVFKFDQIGMQYCTETSSDRTTPRSDAKFAIIDSPVTGCVDSTTGSKTSVHSARQHDCCPFEKPDTSGDWEDNITSGRQSVENPALRNAGWDGCALSQQNTPGRHYPGNSTAAKRQVARHPTDYKHCVTPEPDAVRRSKRERESTQAKLFGKPDSPRPSRKSPVAAETTQQTLFGPPPKERQLSQTRGYTDTHRSLFGPPPAYTRRLNGSRKLDSPDILCHEPPVAGRNIDEIRAMRGRYPLRFEDTASKLFGEMEPCSTTSSPPDSARSSSKRVASARQSFPSTKVSPTYRSEISDWGNHAEEPTSSRSQPPPAEPVAQ